MLLQGCFDMLFLVFGHLLPLLMLFIQEFHGCIEVVGSHAGTRARFVLNMRDSIAHDPFRAFKVCMFEAVLVA